MTSTTQEIQKQKAGQDFYAQLQVYNDDHFPADRVIHAFCQVLPSCTPDRAMDLMLKIHNQGMAVVWQGPREVCELYAEQLGSLGLDARVD